MVTDKSGYAGIARWLNENVPSIKEKKHEEVTKRHPGIRHIALWVEDEYTHGRTTAISANELMIRARRFLPGLFESELDKVKDEAKRIARAIAANVKDARELANLDPAEMDGYLEEIVKREGSIQLLAVTNTEGFPHQPDIRAARRKRRCSAISSRKSFKERDWFNEVIRTGEPYFSHLFFSIYTNRLIITAALPVKDKEGKVRAPSSTSTSSSTN